MKRLLIILLCSIIAAQPLTHRINNYMHDQGYVDRWTWSHVEIGAIKSGANLMLWWMNEKYVWMEEPSPTSQFMGNVFMAVLWEVAEFGIEGNWNWSEYQNMYGGKAWQNNGFDVFVDVVTFGVPLYKGMYYDLKVWRHGFGLSVIMEL